MGKMGVSERVQKNQGRTHTYAHGSHAKQGVRAGTHAHTRHARTRRLSIYSVGTSASLRGSEGLPAHLLKIKQSAVMSYLISLRRGDEEHFSRKSRVCDRLNAQTSL